MQRLADTVLGNAKESLKTFSQEAFNNTVRVINGFSALLLLILPGRSKILEGMQGFELYPTFQAPRMPRWMENGVSSFNAFISEYDSEDEWSSESEYGSGLEEVDDTGPPSPASQTSHMSRHSSTSRVERRHRPLWQRCLRCLTWPLRHWHLPGHRPLMTQGSGTSQENSVPRRSSSSSFRGFARCLSGVKDYVVPRQVADRRRGIIEDLQISIELFIESVFEVVRKGVHHLLSPFQTLKEVTSWVRFWDLAQDNIGAEVVETTILGSDEPVPQVKVQGRQETLNTDSRTCGDIITSLGYPYEVLRVTTADGHILLLERIPRKDSRKVLFLQHGVFDSSLGWVSNGVVGSQAFAAFDQGYDVFLGNLRGLASREHVNKHISSQSYWQFSVNEHGTQDIPAMLTKVHELKTMELAKVRDDENESSDSLKLKEHGLPYTMCGVAHSLGGAALLIYIVTRRLDNKPHYLSRLILLSPAGFHEDAPIALKLVRFMLPVLAPVLSPFVPGIYIPTRLFRGLFNKLSRDFQNYPALGGLVQAVLSYVVGGDNSNWVGAIGVSHYNMNDMPGVSFRVAIHLAQMMRTRRFIMFDFGSVSANMQAYGTPYPLDIGLHYDLIDIPVFIVAGLKDRVIPKSMVRKHYEMMRNAGCQVSYAEFEYAHLDFTFANREELMAYVLSRMSVSLPRKPGNSIAPLVEDQHPTNRSASMKKLNFTHSRQPINKSD